MRAGDLQPSRMEAAKSAARAFVEKQPRRVRIGVVTFSAHAALVQEPTTDREMVDAAINRLRTQRGTAVGSGLLASIDALFRSPGDDTAPLSLDSLDLLGSESNPVPPGTYSNAVIVLLTDGQSNQGPPPLEVAQKISDLGVRIYTVGVGSPEGSIIGIRGRSIRVRLDEENLKSIAEKTNGEYFRANSETELNDIYGTLSTQLVMEREKVEITAFFTAFAALVLLLAGLLSLLWLNRLP